MVDDTVAPSAMKRARERHASDIIRVVLGLTILAVASLPVRPDSVGRSETGAFDLINGLANWLYPPVFLIMQLGAFLAIPALVIVALVLRRRRLALDIGLAGTAVWLLAKVVKGQYGRPRPGGLLETVTYRGSEATGFGFVSGHTAVAVALATAAATHLPRRYRWILGVLAALVGIARLYVGAHLPLDVVGGAGLGWAVGAAIRLAIGSPTGRPEPDRLARALDRLGFAVTRIAPADVPAHVSAPYRLDLEDGRSVFLKVVSEERQDRDALFRLWRWIARRREKHQQRYAASDAQVDHEAALSLAAQRAGVRTPEVVVARALGAGEAMVGTAWLDGHSLDRADATDELLRDVWRQVALLHAAAIAHGGLVRANVVVADDRAWLVDFGYGQLAASPVERNEDVAELLVSLAVTVGPDRALAAAMAELDPEDVRAALACMDDARWSPATRADLASHPDLVDQLRSVRT